MWLLCFELFACQCGSFGLTLWISQVVKNRVALPSFIGAAGFAASALNGQEGTRPG